MSPRVHTALEYSSKGLSEVDIAQCVTYGIYSTIQIAQPIT